MNKRTVAWLLEAILVIGTMAATLVFAQGQKNKADIEAAGQQWLAAMNKDNDRTVDKKEFLDYMAEQFAKADTDNDGTLDLRELGELRMRLAYQH